MVGSRSLHGLATGNRKEMLVGINGLEFYPGRIGGAETYFTNLLQGLQGLDSENQYMVFCHSANERHISITKSNFSKVILGPRQRRLLTPYRAVGKLLRQLFNTDLRKRALESLDVDLIHFPFTIVSPLTITKRAVLTVLDIQQEYHPEFFSQEELQFRTRYYPASAERADAIIAISDYVKRTLVERYGIRQDKIKTVHLAGEAAFRSNLRGEDLAAFRERHGLKSPYLFYPAATWPHKNHITLLKALSLLKKRGFAGTLVLTGMAKQSHDRVTQTMNELGLAEAVRILGYLPYSELPLLFKAARMLVFPSLYEGFGLPVVEAMASGCPVVCSNVTSLPEIVGDAAVTFDPSDPEEIAEAVWKVWHDEALQVQMREKGLERARLFSWEKTAKETIEVYREVAGL